MRFLNENAFATPSWAVKPEILRRIEPSGALARVNMAQERVLNSLLSNTRFDRLVEQEAIDGAAAYRPADFMSDVRRGIWSELEAWSGPHRRLQAQPAELVHRFAVEQVERATGSDGRLSCVDQGGAA